MRCGRPTRCAGATRKLMVAVRNEWVSRRQISLEAGAYSRKARTLIIPRGRLLERNHKPISGPALRAYGDCCAIRLLLGARNDYK